MGKLTYELQFITPCFNGGYLQDQDKSKHSKEQSGNSKYKSELRPASFIGLLRFWGRVVLSSFYKGKELYEKESILFGNEKEAGKFYIRVEKIGEIKHKTLDNKDNKYYTLGMAIKSKECIPENYKFKVHIITKSEYTDIIKNICRLAFSWGSLGFKSRKGLGSLKIVEEFINGQKTTSEINEIELLDPKFWQNILHKDCIENNETPSLKNLKLYRIKINEYENKNKSDGLTKLAFLGERYKNLRKEKIKTPEYKYVINKFLNGEKITSQDISKIKNIPFGLPIQYTSRSRERNGIKPRIVLQWKNKNKDNNRRASMVLFKIKDDYIYALFFKSKLLPDGSCLEVKILNKKDELTRLNLKVKNKDEICKEFNENEKRIIENSIKALKENGFEEVKIQ